MAGPWRWVALLLAVAAGNAGASVVLYDERNDDDERTQLRVWGRVREDVLLADQVSPEVVTRDAELRSIRLGLRQLWRDAWVLRLSADFRDGFDLRDASVEYRGGPLRIEVGRFQEPFSLAESGNPADRLLMERPSVAAFAPHYGLGAAINIGGEGWGYSAGYFTREGGSTFNSPEPESALSMRLTARPWRSSLGYWHIGGSLSLRQPEPGTGVRLSGRDESALLDFISPFSVRVADADHYALAGVESVVRLGPTLIAGEFITAAVQGGRRWSGAYVEAGWALTGEKRGYSTRYGLFGGIRPRRPVGVDGFGAVELVARWSTTDLSDGGGDRGQVISGGINWYPLDQIELSVNAQRIRREFTNGVTADRKADIVQARVQLSF